MMDVRKMRVGVRQRLMHVHVIVRLASVPFEIMLVLMVRIVAMTVRMAQGRMEVGMNMDLGQMHPHANAHQ